MARFTDYALDAAGRFKHTVSAEKTATGWTLALRAAPVQPVMPPSHLPSAEFFAAIAAQSVVLAVREVPNQYVGGYQVRPCVAAQDLVHELLGTAWGVEDKGKGFIINLR